MFLGLGFSHWLLFILGIILGGVFFSPEFRKKFFTGLRNFMKGLGKTKLAPGGTSGSWNRDKIIEVQRREGNPDKIIRVEHVDRRVRDTERVICSTCQGSGQVTEKVSPLMEGAPGYKRKIITCPTCNGEGYK